MFMMMGAAVTALHSTDSYSMAFHRQLPQLLAQLQTCIQLSHHSGSQEPNKYRQLMQLITFHRQLPQLQAQLQTSIQLSHHSGSHCRTQHVQALDDISQTTSTTPGTATASIQLSYDSCSQEPNRYRHLMTATHRQQILLVCTTCRVSFQLPCTTFMWPV